MAVKHPSSERHRLIFRISHAQFDGYSLGPVLTSLSAIYQEKKPPDPSCFAQFMSFNKQRERTNLASWTQRLKGSSFPHWSTSNPTSPPQAYALEDRLLIEDTLPMPPASRTDGYSVATLFHAACCIVLARHFHKEEPIIGRLVTGRSMLPSSLQNTIGPCLSEIPIRTLVKPNDTLLDVARHLHHQFIEDSPHEGLGMDDIIHKCTDWSTAGSHVRDFGWRTAFQQRDDAEGFEFLGAMANVGAFERRMLPRTRPELYATPKGAMLVLSFGGNRRLIGAEVAGKILKEVRELLGGAEV